MYISNNKYDELLAEFFNKLEEDMAESESQKLMNFKILISSLILILHLTLQILMQKMLPPGTGTQSDVPSNLLILLDKSGSMGWRMSSNQSINRMFDGVTDSSGNIYISSIWKLRS